MYMAEIAADIEELQSILGRKAKKDDVEALTWTLGLLGRTFFRGLFCKTDARMGYSLQNNGTLS